MCHKCVINALNNFTTKQRKKMSRYFQNEFFLPILKQMNYTFASDKFNLAQFAVNNLILLTASGNGFLPRFTSLPRCTRNCITGASSGQETKIAELSSEQIEETWRLLLFHLMRPFYHRGSLPLFLFFSAFASSLSTT